ncbi:uncharacterized protein [Parasteatoda tepidariorum]|uniref:uncharacterized protein n=1 Tax=Parasteatoda tepidariorum TaxID=114398 RepID=UPI0039BD7078
MPAIRRRNISGRRQRNEWRNSKRESISRRRESPPLQIRDFYKSALTVHDDCDPFTIGSMTFICNFCHAKHFMLEKTGSSNEYGICCQKGKVDLPLLSHSQYFENLITGVTSLDHTAKKRSQNYLDNIRSYNSAFAMISSETHLDESVTGGMYHFKIHDTFYHSVGSLIPSEGCQPKYAQNYFYDEDTAVEHRMREQANVKCDASIMHEIAVYLNRVNSYVQSFQTMGDLCRNSSDGNEKEMCMHITVNASSDQRRYNDATSTDVSNLLMLRWSTSWGKSCVLKTV